MGIITKLVRKDIVQNNKHGHALSVDKMIRRRCNKKIKLRRIRRTERQIEELLKDDYQTIGKCLNHLTVNKFRKELNKQTWKSERLFLEGIVSHGVFDFWTNYPVLNRFFADVYFDTLKLVVELDGSIHKKKEVRIKDERKDYWLKRFGFKVLRYSVCSKSDADYAVKDFISRIDVNEVKNITHSGLPQMQLRKLDKES